MGLRWGVGGILGCRREAATKALPLETRRGPPDQVVGMKSKPTQNPGPGEDAPALPGRGNPAGFGLAGRKAGDGASNVLLLSTTNANDALLFSAFSIKKVRRKSIRGE